MENELLYKIAITRIPKVGPIIAKNLISHCGGAKAVFEAKRKELLRIPGVGPSIASNILRKDILFGAEIELDFIDKYDIQPLFYLDENYPRRLKHFNDSPILLYYKGNTNLNTEKIVSVVGTRKPTVYGRSICEDLIEDLLAYNVLVVSGLAFGIDITAHRKCVDLAIPTVGVLGHGLGRIYPGEHRHTAEDMIEKGGLLTEFTSDIGPDREHFPMRNRIIAGMCDALVVVETKNKGGSIISAEIANHYHKDVFAFPGRAKDKNSSGCNLLIRTNKAALIENAHHLASIMRWDKTQPQSMQQQLFIDVTNEEEALLNVLKTTEQVGIDKISFELNRPSSEIASMLLLLEFKGLVKTLPGKQFMRLN